MKRWSITMYCIGLAWNAAMWLLHGHAGATGWASINAFFTGWCFLGLITALTREIGK